MAPIVPINILSSNLITYDSRIISSPDLLLLLIVFHFSAMFSPRSSSSSSYSWIERFNLEREALRRELAQKISRNMASIIGHFPTSDVLLVAADGRKFPAHLCILRKRAPNFFRRYVQGTLEAVTPRASAANHLLEIAVGDVDSAALEFFIRSIYTEDEVAELGQKHQQNGHLRGEEDEDGENYGGRDYGGEGGQPAGEGGEGGRFGVEEMMQNGRTTTREDQHMNDHVPGGGRMAPPASSSLSSVMSASFPSPAAELELNAHFGTNRPLGSESTDSSMTSFMEMAAAEEKRQRQQKDVPFNDRSQQKNELPTPRMNPKFIVIAKNDQNRWEEKGTKGEEEREVEEKKIFPLFIGMDGHTLAEKPPPQSPATSSIMARSMPSARDGGGDESPPITMDLIGSIRGRAIARRRMSSLSSLTSIDLLTPTQEEASFSVFQQQLEEDNRTKAVSKLAGDILQIYLDETIERNTKMVLVETKDGNRLKATLCTLWANSKFFRDQLSGQLPSSSAASASSRVLFRVPLRRFSSASVHFLLQFLHSGLTSLPPQSSTDLFDIWELFELGAFVHAELFIRMLELNVRATLFHFFHRPCVSCVSAVFDALPKMELEVPALRQLFDDALQWQASNFTRIWKGRAFLHLSEQWQRRCRDAVLQSVDEESVLEVLLGCEKLQVTLPRLKLSTPVQRVLSMVADVEEYCMELLVGQFDSLISSNAFSHYGKGLALNLALLEDILPPLVHSLSAETTIRAFIALRELLVQLEQPESAIGSDQPVSISSCTNSPLRKVAHRTLFGSTGSIAGEWKWNPRFKALCHRLLELVDRHMLHFANSILNSEDWALLSPAEQDRVKELGLFVELRMPRASPPRLSSFGRVYCKRSSSVGFGQSQLGTEGRERTGSLERKLSKKRLTPTTATSRPSLSTQMEEGDRHAEEEEAEERRMEVEEKEEGNGMPAGKEDWEERRKEEEGGDGRHSGEMMPPSTDQSEPCSTMPSCSRLGTATSTHTKIPAKMKKVESDGERMKREIVKKKKGEENTNEKKTKKKVEEEEAKGAREDELMRGKKKIERKEEDATSAEQRDGHHQIRAVHEEAKQHPRTPLKQAIVEVAGVSKKPLMKVEEFKSLPSTSSSQQQLTFDRQRTHTVMTVDQNLRAGIDAYLGGIAGEGGEGSAGEGGEGSAGEGGERRGDKAGEAAGGEGRRAADRAKTAKPQSIVRPMPQQHRVQQQLQEEERQQRTTTTAPAAALPPKKRTARTVKGTTGGQIPRRKVAAEASKTGGRLG